MLRMRNVWGRREARIDFDYIYDARKSTGTSNDTVDTMRRWTVADDETGSGT